MKFKDKSQQRIGGIQSNKGGSSINNGEDFSSSDFQDNYEESKLSEQNELEDPNNLNEATKKLSMLNIDSVDFKPKSKKKAGGSSSFNTSVDKQSSIDDTSFQIPYEFNGHKIQ